MTGSARAIVSNITRSTKDKIKRATEAIGKLKQERALTRDPIAEPETGGALARDMIAESEPERSVARDVIAESEPERSVARDLGPETVATSDNRFSIEIGHLSDSGAE